jgi:hypothetical protein
MGPTKRLDDFGRLGRAWYETNEEHPDRETLIQHLMERWYEHPVRIVAFNTAEVGRATRSRRSRRSFASGAPIAANCPRQRRSSWTSAEAGFAIASLFWSYEV